MMRLSRLKTFFQRHLLTFLVAALMPFLAKGQLGISVVPNTEISVGDVQPGDMVLMDFTVYDFEDIASMQFTIQFDPSQIQFATIQGLNSPGLTAANFGTANVSTGQVSFSWQSQLGSGVTVPDCTPIFQMGFITYYAQYPSIEINGSIIPIEIIDGNLQQIGLEQTSHCATAVLVSGNIFNDLSANCLKDLGELGLQDWKLKIEQPGNIFYRSTNVNGNYGFYALPGDYEVTLIPPQNNLWTACQTIQSINIPDNQPVTLNFAAQALDDCPNMTVDIAAPFLRRCFNSTYHIHYCNQGTATAEDAYVEVTLDPFLSAVSSSIPWTAVNGQTYTFPIGDVAVGQCADFSFTVHVSCDAVLGQTHCTEAHIFPDDICQPVNPLWDGSLLDVTGNCDGDSVRFIITNIGDDMTTPVPFIVIEDDMVNFSGSPIQLNAGGSFQVAVPANGATWRVELESNQSSPYNGPTAASLEGCGVNGNGSFSLGFVTQFSQGDPSPFTDVDCQPNVGSYDPNDKTGYPNGFCAAHYIESGQDINYRIRFQNTGTDTAFNVIIRDTLPFSLDPATVLPGSSSHPYDFELLGNGVVQFTFPNIMLPDSNVNEMGSHGFVDFTASQMAGNNNGTVINNQAAIYFDFNSPVYTNIYSHTVADNFLQSSGINGSLSISGYVHTWYGEPVEDVEMTFTPTCPIYTNEDGYYISPSLVSGQVTLIPKLINQDKQEDVTILDLLKLRAQITGANPLGSPLQIIAGDINNSNTATTFDALELINFAIGLGGNNNLGNNWRFVPADSVFTPPNDPFSGWPVSTIINFDSLTESLNNVNFFAIKPGNVIVENMVDSSQLIPNFYFKAKSFENGQMKVDIKANDFNLVNGFQFGVVWDMQTLGFANIEPGALTDYYVNDTKAGELQFLAVMPNTQSSTLPDSATLVTLVFDATAPLGSTASLSIDETLLPFQVVVEDCKLAGAIFSPSDFIIANVIPIIEENNFSLQISPNPIQLGNPISMVVASTTAQTINLQLFNVDGQLLDESSKTIPAGISGLNLSPALAKGFYFLKIENGNGEFQTEKIVIY